MLQLAPPDALPAPVLRYLARALPAGDLPPAAVRVRQEGALWRRPGGRPLRFTAVEELAVDRVAFSWRARLPLGLRVVDGYADGEGTLRVRLLGLPLSSQSGSDVAVGEALRYLAELAWVPHAMAANPELEWRALDASRAEVATWVGEQRLAVRLCFDAAGDLARATADARPHDEGGTLVPRPWGGDFRAHALLAGVRVPTCGEAWWELPEGRFVYWRARVTELLALSR
jgi:hypothetical protein